jgi:long-chain acyl-CoA synthetase
VQCRIAPDTGEIQVKAAWNMLGYYKEPEQTREMPSPPTAGCAPATRAHRTPRVNLKITGRVKDLFKTSKGKYVAPAPIEDKLVMHNAVEACCVTGANLGQPLAWLMLNAEATLTAAENGGKAELEASLAEHLKPSTRRSIRTSSSTAWSSPPRPGRWTTT